MASRQHKAVHRGDNGAFDDVDDLFARMFVLRSRYARVEIDACLDLLPAWKAEIIAGRRLCECQPCSVFIRTPASCPPSGVAQLPASSAIS